MAIFIVLLLLSTILVVFLFFGRTTTEGAKIGLYDMEMELADSSGIEVESFGLGMIELSAANGNLVVAPLTGILAKPAGDALHPLVVIIHGASPVADIHESTYAGFDYLVKQLAAEGYVAVSINVNVNYTFEFGESVLQDGWAMDIVDAHVSALASLGRVDLSEIHLIGHSRGGEVAESLVRRQEENGDRNIKSIIRLAPIAALQEGYPDIPFGIILPEFDGDVSEKEGQIVFDEILGLRENESFGSLVYLRGANHNFFNRKFEEDDRYFERSFADIENRETWITREEQEDFTKRYVVAFLSVVRGERQPWGAFDIGSVNPNRMFGRDVVVSSYFGGVQVFVQLPEENSAARVSGNAEMSFYLQSIPINSTYPGLFNHPTVMARRDQRLELYNITWTDRTGRVVFDSKISDLSSKKSISLFVVQDMPNELNEMGQNQAFTVVLRDRSGNESYVIVPEGTSALQYHTRRYSRKRMVPETCG